MTLTVDDIVKLLQSGGNLALMLGIWFGNRILRKVSDFVDSVEEIRKNVAHVRAIVDGDRAASFSEPDAQDMPTEHPNHAIRRLRLRR